MTVFLKEELEDNHWDEMKKTLKPWMGKTAATLAQIHLPSTYKLTYEPPVVLVDASGRLFILASTEAVMLQPSIRWDEALNPGPATVGAGSHEWELAGRGSAPVWEKV